MSFSEDNHTSIQPLQLDSPPLDGPDMARLEADSWLFRQKTLAWLISASSWLLTCKHLLAGIYHYPATLALHSFISLYIVYSIALIGSYWYYKFYHMQRNEFYGRTARSDGHPLRLWQRMIPPSLIFAASIPVFMEGILYMHSLPVIVMILPMIFATELLTLKINSIRTSRFTHPYEILGTVAMSALILYKEYRLLVNGLVFGIVGILLAGFAKALFIICAKTNDTSTSPLKLRAYHCFIIITSLSGAILSFVTSLRYEPEIPVILSWSTTLLIALNIFSFISLAFIGTAFVGDLPYAIESRNFSVSGYEFLGTVGASIVTLVISVISTPIVVSSMQLMCWILSILSIASVKISTQYELGKWLETPWKTKYNRRWPFLNSFAAIVAFSGSLIYVCSTARMHFVSSGIPATLDLEYKPAARFDIVVSIYEESHSSVKAILERLKATALLRGLEQPPNVIIYTKLASEDLETLKKNTGASSVFKLENLGREGATYIHHIVKSWDTLAEQTMFIQAHPHNMREIIPRIDSYLAKETGFLSLGYAEIVCNCLSCTGGWDGIDQVQLMPTLYQQVYGQSCSSSTELLVTFKGQFVSSARRIRGVQLSVYEGLLATLTSPVILHPNITGPYKNTPSAPYFGYALERAWGVLMQCATDMRVGWRCPSLISGMGWSGNGLGDCGCLDEI